MSTRRRSFWQLVGCLAPAMLGAIGFAFAQAEASLPFDDWSLLRLDGRKFLVASGRSEISRWREACGAGGQLVTVRSEAHVFGARAGEHLAASVRNSGELNTIRWSEHSVGKRARVGEVGSEKIDFVVTTYRPNDAQEDTPLSAWPVVESRQWPLTEVDSSADKRPAPLGPIDPYALLDQLGELVSRGEGEIALLTRRGLARLAFVTAARESKRYRIRNLDTGEVVRRMLETVAVDLLPADTKQGETVLNLRGATRMWIEPRTGALLQIEGHHKGVGGKITMRLSAFSQQIAPAPDLTWPGHMEADACGNALPAYDALDETSSDS